MPLFMRGRYTWISLLALALLVGAGTMRTFADDRLLQEFESPPDSAKPRLWWHWMNGNVTKDGIRADLEWMKRIGVGGVNIIQASFDTPPVVKERLAYMSPRWKDALRYAVGLADELGLEVSIGASPGWSGTGGPSVAPAQAMKKLVWSKTLIDGGKAFKGRLPAPPSVSGPFQEVGYVPRNEAWVDIKAPPKSPEFYADAAVVAYPMPQAQPIARVAVTSSDGVIEERLLDDGDLRKQVSLSGDTDRAWIEFTYDRPQTIRTAVLRIPVPAPGAYVYRSAFDADLEAQDTQGQFHSVAPLRVTVSPQVTVSFAPVTARVFRVFFTRPALTNPLGLPFDPFASGIDVSTFRVPPPHPPFVVSELSLRPMGSVNEFERKAGFALADDYYALATPEEAANAPVPRADIINLTARMKSDGTLDWRAPPGRWVVLRLGYSLTGMTNFPAPSEATGLELDKLNARIAEDYMNLYLDAYTKILPSSLIGRHGLNAVTVDSTEAGPQNWTDDMLMQFRRLQRYDPAPWLPSLTGVIVESAAASDQFLWDFRRTIAQLRSEGHEAAIASAAHARGLTVYGEALENGRPELADEMEMRRNADVPMGAMWAYPLEGDPPPSYVADDRGAASVAHLYGQNLVAAESFTSALKPWGQAPRELKPIADLEFALGINRIVVHTSVHQPNPQPPGLTLGIAGQYFNRLDTWAPFAAPWMTYLARSSYLLQQGRRAADVAYFYGEEAPLTVLQGIGRLNDVPTVHGFDFVNGDALLHLLQCRDGALWTPSGMRYRLLQLGGTSDRMTLPVLRRIKELVSQGALVTGAPPTESPSLNDRDDEFKRLVAELWEPGGEGARLGRGRVIRTGNVDDVLTERGVAPDVEVSAPSAADAVMFLHRSMPDREIYFLTHRVHREESVEASFRVTAKVPELWHADTGAAEPVSYRTENGRTIVPLQLAPDDAVFVVFRQTTTAPTAVVSRSAAQKLRELAGPWTVNFEPGRGVPPEITFDRLQSWSVSTAPGVRYFSGTATYRTTLDAPTEWFTPGARLSLYLGEVRELAEVALNGQVLGTLWTPPYRVEVTGVLHPGANTLTVRVANLWVNRLIGDQQPGATHYTATYLPTYIADAPLRLSGLLGPVAVMREEVSHAVR